VLSERSGAPGQAQLCKVAHSSATAASKPRRGPGRPFVKGRSGNPSGRTRTRDLQARAREFTEEAIQALVAALKNPKERVQAAGILLDRGWGKAKQAIEVDGSQQLTMLHLIAARAISHELRTGLERDLPANPNGQTALEALDWSDWSEPAAE
jgi:hypothetical protein